MAYSDAAGCEDRQGIGPQTDSAQGRGACMETSVKALAGVEELTIEERVAALEAWREAHG